MIRTALTAALAVLMLTLPATADLVRDCDDRIGAAAIAEPWEEYSRGNANNAIRIAMLDHEGPASSGLILIALSWTTDPHEGRTCKIITAIDGFPGGWAGIKFEEIASDYNPHEGLIISVPVLPYDAVGHTGANEAKKYNVTFAINRATGALTLK